MKRLLIGVVFTGIVLGMTGCNLGGEILDFIFGDGETTQSEGYQQAYDDNDGKNEDLSIVSLFPSTSVDIYPTTTIQLYLNDLVNPDTVQGNIVVNSGGNVLNPNINLHTWDVGGVPQAHIFIVPVPGWPEGTLEVEIKQGLRNKQGYSFPGTSNTLEYTVKKGATGVNTETSYNFESSLDSNLISITGHGGLFGVDNLDFTPPQGWGNDAVLISSAGEWDHKPDFDGLAGDAVRPDGYDGEYSEAVIRNLKIPSGRTKLLLDYYFVSDEFPNFIGTSFDDIATYVVLDTESGKFASSAFESVNMYEHGDVGNALIKTDAFPSYDDIYRTELKVLEIDISGFSGLLELTLNIADVGDNIYNSYLIFDNLRFDN